VPDDDDVFGRPVPTNNDFEAILAQRMAARGVQPPANPQPFNSANMSLEEMRAQLQDPNRFQNAMNQRLRQNNAAAQYHLAQHHHAHPNRYDRRRPAPPPPPPLPSQIEHHQENVDNLRNQIRNANGIDEQLRRALDDLQQRQNEVQWVRNIYCPPEVDDDQGQENPDP
jgi:hypothetical protein